MTTYNGIAGGRVNFLSSDPTYNSSAQDGQVWYNSNSGTLKAWIPVGAWASGGNLSTARYGLSGAGTQTAGLAFGGYTTANSNATEEYDGIHLDSWWKFRNG
jgi:hypothetical protein